MAVVQEILPDEGSSLDVVVLDMADPDREHFSFVTYGAMPYVLKGASASSGAHAKEWRAGCLRAFLMARTLAAAKSPSSSVCNIVGTLGDSALYWRSALAALHATFKDYDEVDEARRNIRDSFNSWIRGLGSYTRTVVKDQSGKFIVYNIESTEPIAPPLGNDIQWTEDEILSQLNAFTTIGALSAKPTGFSIVDEDVRNARLIGNGYFVRWTKNGSGPSNIPSGLGAHTPGPDDFTPDARPVVMSLQTYHPLGLIPAEQMAKALIDFDLVQCLCALSQLNTLCVRDVKGKSTLFAHYEAAAWSQAGRHSTILSCVPSVELVFNAKPKSDSVAPYIYTDGDLSDTALKAKIGGRLPQFKSALSKGSFARINTYDDLDGENSVVDLWAWTPSDDNPYTGLDHPILLQWGYDGGAASPMAQFLTAKNSSVYPSLKGQNGVSVFLAPPGVTPSVATLDKLDYLWPNLTGNDGTTYKVDSYALAKGLFKRFEEMKSLLDAIKAEVKLSEAASQPSQTPSSSKESSNLLIYLIIILIAVLFIVLLATRGSK